MTIIKVIENCLDKPAVQKGKFFSNCKAYPGPVLQPVSLSVVSHKIDNIYSLHTRCGIFRGMIFLWSVQCFNGLHGLISNCVRVTAPFNRELGKDQFCVYTELSHEELDGQNRGEECSYHRWY